MSFWDFLKNQPVILASNSPRRKQLLSEMGLRFRVIVPRDVDEKIDFKPSALDAVMSLSKRKASAVKEVSEGWIIAADTIVIVNGDVLGKPEDQDDARRMLHALSGKSHQVVTGFTILNASVKKSISASVSTEVVFYNLSASDTDKYIETGEPFDKAGAYGIQGIAGLMIKQINGCFFNVVGLPVSALRQEWIKFSREIYG